MPRYYAPHGSNLTDYIYVCDNCEIDDGRPVLIWNCDKPRYFALCYQCINNLPKQYESPFLKQLPRKPIEYDINGQDKSLGTNDLRQSSKYRQWVRAVFAANPHNCKDCGQGTPVVKLHAHHIKSFAQYPELRYVVSNGELLCENCHKAHRRDKTQILTGTNNAK
jgi:hypothetical protein